jgi:predicted HTH transcriptional regulator
VGFTGWLEYFTDGIIGELQRVRKNLMEISFGPATELYSYHEEILKHIEKKGYITDRDYAKITERAKATGSLDFKRLIDIGFIERMGKGRATYYILKDK